MQLWAGTSQQFIHDAIQNQIADKLRNAWFAQYRFYPGTSEVRSWQNSLQRMSSVIQYAQLLDHGVVLEYQLPLTSKRIDCILTGRDDQGRDGAVVIELKQWEKCEPAEGDRVVTWVGGGHREALHPSFQCDSYRQYLQDCHTAFYETNAVVLSACTYLHNYSFASDDPLLDAKFGDVISRVPVFSKDDVDRLRDFLTSPLSAGNGLEVLQRVQASEFRPSKKLMDHVAEVVKGRSDYVLLDEQLLVYDKVFSIVKRGYHHGRKHVVIVRGGPGTGKSVVAINLMADLLREHYNSQYATGSKAFTETLRKKIGTRGGVMFKYFNSYGSAGQNVVDVLVMDEAHRIRKTSASRFTRKEARTGLPQVDELLRAAKVSVFFIDDDQVVRPDEIGSSAYIAEAAERAGAQVHNFELETQFRCAGSDAFLNWVNNTLGIKRTANVLWEGDERFDFRIVDSPSSLDDLLRARRGRGSTARMVAGYCWEWSPPTHEGELRDDVRIGEFRRPWNASPDARKLSPKFPPAPLWATDPRGEGQVGCIYTAQGFEFDYAGVIFGPDLVYDPSRSDWVGHPDRSRDPMVKRAKGGFTALIKNTYRVLLSRGMKGCYVYFMDDATRNFFLSRMDPPKK